MGVPADMKRLTASSDTHDAKQYIFIKYALLRLYVVRRGTYRFIEVEASFGHCNNDAKHYV